MIKGSHNSLTYYKPTKWWMWRYKCQDKTFEKQIRSGIHAFDIKVRFDNNNNVHVTNGKYTSEESWSHYSFVSYILDTISLINPTDRRYFINLTLDTNDVNLFQEINFIQLCNKFVKHSKKNKHIILGGRRTFDNDKVVVTLQDTYIVKSVAGYDTRTRFYERWFPSLFAKRMNKNNLKFWKDHFCIVFFDFL